jgi:hypothetical protein
VPTDRADPHQQQEQAEDHHQGSGATAGSSQQDAPHLEQVDENGGGERPREQQKEQDPAGSCDLYRGRWVYDEARAPLYKEHGCGFLTEQVTCMRNGRRDDAYQKWRWQPDGCDLPRCAPPTEPLLNPDPLLRLHPFLPRRTFPIFSSRVRHCSRSCVRTRTSGSGLVRGSLSWRFPFFLFRNRRIVSASWVAQISLGRYFPLCRRGDTPNLCLRVREGYSLQASLIVFFWMDSAPHC